MIVWGRVILLLLPEVVPVQLMFPVPVPVNSIEPSLPPQLVVFVTEPGAIVGVGLTVITVGAELAEQPVKSTVTE